MIRHFLISSLMMITIALVTASAPGLAQTAEGPEPIKIERKGGPPTIPEVARDEVICFALYTVQDNILKLSAQLYPLQGGEAREVTLEIKDGDAWKPVAA